MGPTADDLAPGQKADIVDRLGGCRVLVLGDLFLDEYLEGRAQRLSREAPVPVVELTSRVLIPGGAANPARNLVALGGRAVISGLVGDDEQGRSLLTLLRESGVDTAGVVIDPQRQTATKTRVVASRDLLRFPQHLARIDRVDRAPLAGVSLSRLLDRLEVLIPQVDAVLVSDYRSGILTPTVVGAVTRSAARASVFTAVDAQGNLGQYAGFRLLKCNRGEAEAESGRQLMADADYEEVLQQLMHRLAIELMVITRGPEGMSIREAKAPPQHLAATNRSDVYDVTGAGDTVIGVLALGLAARASLKEATCLANQAAGIVVGKVGTATVSQTELIQTL